MPVWGEAIERGLVKRINGSRQVVITDAGRAELEASKSCSAAAPKDMRQKKSGQQARN
jgi:hypothetical protein